MSKNAPRDARELVGQSNGEHVVMQPLLGGLDPRLEPVALPSVRFHFHKNDPCCLHEQDTQVAIAALRYLAEDRAVPGRDLPRAAVSGARPPMLTKVVSFSTILRWAESSIRRGRTLALAGLLEISAAHARRQ